MDCHLHLRTHYKLTRLLPHWTVLQIPPAKLATKQNIWSYRVAWSALWWWPCFKFTNHYSQCYYWEHWKVLKAKTYVSDVILRLRPFGNKLETRHPRTSVLKSHNCCKCLLYFYNSIFIDDQNAFFGHRCHNIGGLLPSLCLSVCLSVCLSAALCIVVKRCKICL